MTAGIIAGIVSIIAAIIIGLFYGGKRWYLISTPFLIPYLIVVLAIGQPKPVWLEFSNKFYLISYTLRENEAIYLWVVPEGSNKPVALQLPWSDRQANKVIKEMQQGEETGTMPGIAIIDGLGGEITEWDAPVQPLPPKGE